MIGFGHSPERSLHETIFTVYASKKRAEVAPGVGNETDLAIIHEGGIRRLTQPELDGLDGLYQEYIQPLRQQLRDKVEALNLFGKGQKK